MFQLQVDSFHVLQQLGRFLKRHSHSSHTGLQGLGEYLLDPVLRQLMSTLVLFGSLASLASTNVLDHRRLVRWMLLLVVVADQQGLEVGLIGGIDAGVGMEVGQTGDVVLLSQQDRQGNGILCSIGRETETSDLPLRAL